MGTSLRVQAATSRIWPSTGRAVGRSQLTSLAGSSLRQCRDHTRLQGTQQPPVKLGRQEEAASPLLALPSLV